MAASRMGLDVAVDSKVSSFDLFIDWGRGALHDNWVTFPSDHDAPQGDDKRRSSRVFTRIPVRASGRNTQGRKFRENSQTIVVNAHGGLLYLSQTVELGADVLLINPATEEEQECRVVYLGDTSEKGQRVGIEFLSPAPRFWGVEFAPGDWPPRRTVTPAS
jgi:hypothetical protein